MTTDDDTDLGPVGKILDGAAAAKETIGENFNDAANYVKGADESEYDVDRGKRNTIIAGGTAAGGVLALGGATAYRNRDTLPGGSEEPAEEPDVSGEDASEDIEYVGSDGDIPSGNRSFSVDQANDLLSILRGECSVDEIYGETIGEVEVGYAAHATDIDEELKNQLGPQQGNSEDGYEWFSISAEVPPAGRKIGDTEEDADTLIMAKGLDQTYEMSAGEVANMLDDDVHDSYLEDNDVEVAFVPNEVYCD